MSTGKFQDSETVVLDNQIIHQPKENSIHVAFEDKQNSIIPSLLLRSLVEINFIDFLPLLESIPEEDRDVNECTVDRFVEYTL